MTIKKMYNTYVWGSEMLSTRFKVVSYINDRENFQNRLEYNLLKKVDFVRQPKMCFTLFNSFTKSVVPPPAIKNYY